MEQPAPRSLPQGSYEPRLALGRPDGFKPLRSEPAPAVLRPRSSPRPAAQRYREAKCGRPSAQEAQEAAEETGGGTRWSLGRAPAQGYREMDREKATTGASWMERGFRSRICFQRDDGGRLRWGTGVWPRSRDRRDRDRHGRAAPRAPILKIHTSV